MEGHMFGKSIQSNTAEPSFFYLLIAATSFQRAGRTRHPHAGDALRDIGREYLAKAAPMHGYSLYAPDRRGWIEVKLETEP
jgi:hypothetical protein